MAVYFKDTMEIPWIACLQGYFHLRGFLSLPLLLFLIATVLPSRSDADNRASVNVHSQHWAYDALETLGAGRLLRYPSPGIRPLSRHSIAHMIADLPEDTLLEEPYRTSLKRLRRKLPDLGSRISDLGFTIPHSLSALQCTIQTPHLSPPTVPAFQSAIRNPQSAIVPHVAVETVAIGSSRDFRKNLDPYTPYRFSQGANLGLKLSLGATITRYAAIFLSPYVLETREGPKTGVDRIYLNLRMSGITVEIGRDALRWGPGHHGNFVMTDNPPPLPMIKVGATTGGFRGVLLLVDGLSVSEGEEARLLGTTVEWSYFRRLAIQGSLGIVSGGKVSDLLRLITSPTESDILGNQIAELGLSICPWKGIRLYGVTAGDDIWGVGWAKRLISWGRASAGLVGAYFADPLRNGRTDFRFEWARLIEEGQKTLAYYGWYYHEELRPYPYLYKGYIIGHPMARGWEGEGYRANRRDLFLRVTHRLSPDMILGVDWDLESAEAGVPSPEPEGILHLDDELAQLSFDLRWTPVDRWSVCWEGTAFFEVRTARDTGETWSSREDLVCRLTMAYRVW